MIRRMALNSLAYDGKISRRLEQKTFLVKEPLRTPGSDWNRIHLPGGDTEPTVRPVLRRRED